MATNPATACLDANAAALLHLRQNHRKHIAFKMDRKVRKALLTGGALN